MRVYKGFLMMEVLVGLSLVLFVSMLIMQWHNNRIIEEKRNITELARLVEMFSVIHEIKAGKLPLIGSRAEKIGNYVWQSHFSEECQCWIVSLVSSCVLGKKNIVFGV